MKKSSSIVEHGDMLWLIWTKLQFPLKTDLQIEFQNLESFNYTSWILLLFFQKIWVILGKEHGMHTALKMDKNWSFYFQTPDLMFKINNIFDLFILYTYFRKKSLVTA